MKISKKKKFTLSLHSTEAFNFLKMNKGDFFRKTTYVPQTSIHFTPVKTAIIAISEIFHSSSLF